jgi:peptidoglycan/xylan/chitin deacetylase (PgdA/CDA1 family)
MITFDDGYRDNFTAAFPILKAAGVPAVFFIPTGFVGTSQVPWWDEIAWMVRHTTKKSVEIPFTGERLQLNGVPRNVAIRTVLTAFKRSPGETTRKVGELRKVLDCKLPEAASEKLFVNWDDLESMRRAGMDIGSHTHSHQILSHLSASEQLEELRRSKQLLEAHLGESVDSIAYPVGAVDSFTNETMALTQQCGYKVGFSFINGANLASDLPRYSMRRIAVEDNASAADLQYSTAFAGAPSVAHRVVGHLARRVVG